MILIYNEDVTSGEDFVLDVSGKPVMKLSSIASNYYIEFNDEKEKRAFNHFINDLSGNEFDSMAFSNKKSASDEKELLRTIENLKKEIEALRIERFHGPISGLELE